MIVAQPFRLRVPAVIAPPVWNSRADASGEASLP